jgi:hypothetical protein
MKSRIEEEVWKADSLAETAAEYVERADKR